MVIWNCLDLARQDEDEKDAIRSLDLLYRRVEGGLRNSKKCMVDTFPREDPFTILVPVGFDIGKHHGHLPQPLEADDTLLRVDFVREVDTLLKEV